MRKFLCGLLAGVAVIALIAFTYVRFGFFDPRADIPVNRLEQEIAMPSLDASIKRHAVHTGSVDGDDADLIAGMKLYQANCASCHGDVDHPHGALADALYPRAPQFLKEVPDMTEDENFYIIQHGIRLSGMPAWKPLFNDHQIWQITAFLSHIDKLPVDVSTQWKAEATTD
jgi:mono/diheme cytochrome c family protein